MRSGQEIQQALRAFVARWKDYEGGEKGEAQTFLTELFHAYGTDRVEAGAQRQMIDQFGPAENPLPLVGLPGIQHADALRTPWPETECIIGNPPFMGASHVRGNLGDEYTEWLKKRFGVGVKDLCTYWFRLGHEHLDEGARAGLVGTNSIAQNLGRTASLAYILGTGGTITDAVASQKWPGEAKVHVSLVNWIKGEYSGQFHIDGDEVLGIDASLRVPSDWEPVVLQQNAGKCFEGPSPKAKGLVLTNAKAEELLSADPRNSDVVRRYLTASDLTDDPAQDPSRWCIDFGLMPLEEAITYSAPMAWVRAEVKPVREQNNRRSYRENWWKFAEPRTAMRKELSDLARFPAIAGHSKRVSIAWVFSDVLPSNATDVFVFDDDFSMGVLQSSTHAAWAWFRSSTLETRLRYTPTTSFQTFPWPDRATAVQREAVAAGCRAMLAERSRICTERQIGLTELYNLVDEGAFTGLADLHKKLDVAVAECYGWPSAIAQDDAELVRKLLDLNREISQGDRDYEPF